MVPFHVAVPAIFVESNVNELGKKTEKIQYVACAHTMPESPMLWFCLREVTYRICYADYPIVDLLEREKKTTTRETKETKGSRKDRPMGILYSLSIANLLASALRMGT